MSHPELITSTPAGHADTDRQGPIRIACGLAAAGAFVPFALSSFSGDSGEEITASVLADAMTLQISASVAMLVGALLVLASVRLGRLTGGVAGAVTLASGVATSILFAAYYASFAAGAVVAEYSLDSPGPGVGEGTALLVNVMELTRYAPGLALVAAAVVAGPALPRPVRITAGVLAVLTIVPLTSWVAALLIPLWLGVSAAAVRGR